MNNLMIPETEQMLPAESDPGAGSGGETPEGKLDKRSVNYRFGQDDSTCAHCKQFLDPNACIKVDGLINPTGTCDLFEPALSNSSPDTSALTTELLAGTDGGSDV